MCTVLDAVAKQLKLTKQQVQQAIEAAVSTGKATAKQVYEEVLKVLQGDIVCERILGAEVRKEENQNPFALSVPFFAIMWSQFTRAE